MKKMVSLLTHICVTPNCIVHAGSLASLGLNELLFYTKRWLERIFTPMSSNQYNSSGNALNTLRPRQNGRHFADDIFKCIFLNENVLISIKISLKFVPKGQINNITASVLIMAWRRPGDKPLSEPMMASLPTHICVTRPQWFNTNYNAYRYVACFPAPDNNDKGHKYKFVSLLLCWIFHTIF